jgi:pimeloyl-ACP methyl ester carboxylesterase
MPFVRFEGRRLHYLVRGAGAPTVLIHGLGSSAADWAFQVPALEHDCQLILPDLPGCGLSAPPPHPYSVAHWAQAIWGLLDALELRQPNLVGFSMGGAVALEMALQRPAAVPRLALINSLASYRVDHWTKWCKARIDAGLVRLVGIRRTAALIAARLFPDPAQAAMRERAAIVIGSVPAKTYLDMAKALERWSCVARLDQLRCRSLLIAAEYDYTPLAEKRALAARLGAGCVVVRDSRHGTPFDAISVTNASLRALLLDQALPPESEWRRDDPSQPLPVSLANSLADEHAAVVAAVAATAAPVARTPEEPQTAVASSDAASAAALESGDPAADP